jgi:hypothetical protein
LEPTDEPHSAPRPEPSPEPSKPTGLKGPAKIAAPVIAALLIGGAAVFAFDHNSGSGANAGTQAVSAGGGQGGFGGPGAGGGNGGGIDGEQHVQGTVTGTTDTTVTVKSSSGTATYTVNQLSQIVRDGQAVKLSAIKAGDPVLVHVYPGSSGQMLVERLFAGSSASGGGPGFGPPGQNGSSGASGV